MLFSNNHFQQWSNILDKFMRASFNDHIIINLNKEQNEGQYI